MPKAAAPAAKSAADADAAAADDADVVGEALVWSGVDGGRRHAAAREARATARSSARYASVDMTAVERIDFVCAGALLNLITRVETQRKSVQIIGATPIIRAHAAAHRHFAAAFRQEARMTAE